MTKQKECYVIMPYGGDDPKARQNFDMVYEYIIAPAAKECGYSVVREDHAPSYGNISQNIVRHLISADLVIADLTHGNGNVFYELGIRHVFCKSKTVTIIDKISPLKFDVAAYESVVYEVDLGSIKDAQERIKKAILAREQNPGNADNVVHDTFAALPESLFTLLEGNQDENMREMQATITRLREENTKLHTKLDNAGIGDTGTSKEKDLASTFKSIRDSVAYSGNRAIIRLNELADQNKIDEFLDFLERVLTDGHITEVQYLQISRMCNNLSLVEARGLVLEQALERFGEGDNLRREMIDFYGENRATVGKALVLINEWVGIKKRNGKYEIDPADIRKLDSEMVGVLCNTYYRMNLLDDIDEILDLLLAAEIDRLRPILYRNKATVRVKKNDIDGAQKSYDTLFSFEDGYLDDQSHRAYSIFLDKLGRKKEEYMEDEMTIALDTEYGQWFYEIALDILSDRYIRVEEGSDGIVKVGKEEAQKAAIPFLCHYLIVAGVNQNALLQMQGLMLRNGMKDEWKIIMSQLESGTFPDYTNYNDYPLNYCLNMKVKFPPQ